MAEVETRGLADGKDGAESLLRDPLEDDADVTGVIDDDDEDEVEVRRKLMAERQHAFPVLAEAETPSSSAAAFTGYSLTAGGQSDRSSSSGSLMQVVAVLGMSFGCYIHGTTVTFPAVFIPSLLASNGTNVSDTLLQPPPFFVYEEDTALIVSIASFGMLAGSLTAGPLANLIGRRWTAVVGTCLCLALGYALIPFAQWLWMLLLGRFLMGAGLGFSTTVSTLYIMEVATPNARAGLAVVPAVMGTLGVLTCQCLGAVLDWQWLSIVLAALNAPYLVMLLLLVPETPVYLVSTDQLERAHRVLRRLRGKLWDVSSELSDLVCAAEGEAEDNHKQRAAVTPADFLTAAVVKPFAIALALMFFFQFSGINIILQYTVDIFQTAESSIDEFAATIFVGIALLISNIITLLVANRMPRRLMLLLSSLGISVTLTVMGVYFFLKSLEKACCDKSAGGLYSVGGGVVSPVAERLLESGANDAASAASSSIRLLADEQEATTTAVADCAEIYTANLGWLPLFVLMLYIFFFNLGYGAMIWITVAEILPLRVRSVTNSLSVGFTCVCSFLTSHTYPSLMASIGGEGVFWLYGGISLVGFVFILIFVPETKDKSEAEISEFFLPSSQRRATRISLNATEAQ